MGQLNRGLPETGFKDSKCLLHNNPSSPVTPIVPLFSSGTWLANWCQQPGPKRIPGISNDPTIYLPIFKLCRKRTIGPNKCVMGWSWPFTYYVQKSVWRLKHDSKNNMKRRFVTRPQEEGLLKLICILCFS